MQKLYFESPTLETFLKVLQPLWSEDTLSVSLIGQNNLAVELAEAASQQGITIRRSEATSAASSDKTQLFIFTEELGEELSKQLLSCVALTNVVVLAPKTDWHFSQKPLFLVSIPKSGTHLVYELARALGYFEGVEPPEFPHGQTWYCVEYTNSHTVARDFFVDTVRRAPFGNRHHSFMRSPALFMYRHPLDILISETHYYNQDGKTAFAGWLDGIDFDERVSRLLNDNWLVGSLRERICGFLPWLDFPNVISLSFEELIGAAGGGNDADQTQLIWSIQLKLQVPGDPKDIASHIFNPDSATFRSGQIGGNKKYLSADIVSDFAARNEDILTKLGYPQDGSVSLPMGRKARRTRPIIYSKADFESMPLTIESDFLGCNLVRYSKRIYAVPIVAGLVALEALSEDVLARIPSAPSLSEVKAILLFGSNDLTHLRQSLEKLAQVIQGKAATQSVRQYWLDTDTPCIIEEYNGFNLISYKSRFLGIRQSIGAVDLSENLSSLVQSRATDDFLTSHSIVQLRDEIDGIATSKRVHQEAVAAHERVMALIGLLDVQLAKVGSDVMAERQSNKHEIDTVRQEEVVADERTSQMLGELKSELNKVAAALLADRHSNKHEVDTIRQEAVAADERTSHALGDLNLELTKIATTLLAERQTSVNEVDAVRLQSEARYEQALDAVSALEGQLALCQRQIIVQDQQIRILQTNLWVRIVKGIKRVLRGTK